MIKEHYYWLDWMKAIGMYFIVAGHLEPVGLEYIYVFSVPLVFCISGFLAKKEINSTVFWQKIWNNLILPCILISAIMHGFDIMLDVVHGVFSPWLIPYRIFNSLLGVHGLNTEAGGLGLCWFIYTLVICKIFYQYTCDKKYLNWFLVLFSICVALYYNMQSETIYNSILNVSLAYPFYLLGGGCKVLYDRFQNFLKNVSIAGCWAILASSIIVVFVVGRINGAPWMFEAHYGKNIILFFIGGISGTVSIFMFSFLMNSFQTTVVDIISRGTIVILGFQLILIQLYYHVPKGWLGAIDDYFAAFIILLLFVPIILFTERFFPVILGSRVLHRHEEFTHNNK